MNTLPATFTGVLPCADCEGLRYALVLRPDHVYFLRTTYLGEGSPEGASVDDIGVWSVAPDGGAIVLRGGREVPEMFAPRGADTLRKLDREGREIASKANYELRRMDRSEPLEPRLEMRGAFTYMADAAQFRECLTGMALPVAMEGDYLALERAYGAARRAPGEALAVSLRGRIARRPRLEGAGEEEVLVVDEFRSVSPGEPCGGPAKASSLQGVDWKLTHLGGDPVPPGSTPREPVLRLVAEQRRAQGNGGCNQFSGSYELDGKKVAFSKVIATRMACVQGMDVEGRFLAALEAAARWDILAGRLELYDANGVLLARFEPGAAK